MICSVASLCHPRSMNNSHVRIHSIVSQMAASGSRNEPMFSFSGRFLGLSAPSLSDTSQR